MSAYLKREQAMARARIVKAMMECPSQWKIEVWDNAGWHFKLRRGPLSLYENSYNRGERRYHCLLSSDLVSPCGGLMVWTDRQTYKSPNMAVKRQLTIAKKYIAKLQAAVEAAYPKQPTSKRKQLC